jgi:hypothetical protein
MSHVDRCSLPATLGLAALSLLLFAGPVQAGYRVKDDAPPEVRKYLESAITAGRSAHEKRVGQAKAELEQAQTELEAVRRAFRKLKAKRVDVQAAEEQVAAAEKRLGDVRAEPALALLPLEALDRDGAIGTLPHGIGVSRIINETRAIVYVFIERAGTGDGKLFTDTDEIGKEIIPSKSPVLLDGVPTKDWSQGDRVPADRSVYRVGKAETIDDQRLHVLTPVDLMQYLIADK